MSFPLMTSTVAQLVVIIVFQLASLRLLQMQPEYVRFRGGPELHDTVVSGWHTDVRPRRCPASICPGTTATFGRLQSCSYRHCAYVSPKMSLVRLTSALRITTPC